MLIEICIATVVAPLVFVLVLRPKDVPQPHPVSPESHREDRKAAIYENLRDLQFEFRLGKLSETDYLATKLTLQRELAALTERRIA